MAGADNDSDDDADTSEDDEESAKRPKHISGDDLGDSFSHDTESKLKVCWIDEVLRKENTSDLESEDGTSSGESEEDDDEGSKEGSDDSHDKDELSQSLKDWEQSDDENIDTNFEDDEEEASEDDDNEEEDEEAGKEDDGSCKLVDIVDQKKSSESRGKQNTGSSTRELKTSLKEDLHHQVELPYTIEAPKNFEELSALLENLSDEQIVEAIRRIRTFNAITVAAENRKKMQV